MSVDARVALDSSLLISERLCLLEVYLCEDSNPDIVRSDQKVMVAIIRSNGRVDEAVSVRNDMCCFEV